VNVCLGSDSLATVYKTRRQTVELSMFEEMREFATRQKMVTPKFILQAATLNGARALGLSGQVGELSAGAFADLVTLPFEGKPAEALDSVIHHQGPVSATMIGGRWISSGV
jgi:cytosine/adenosine deaminase-related metal-dependent hydrolase